MENLYSNKRSVISIISSSSNSGKTTLIEGIIRILKSRGYKVGAIKNDAHKLQIDYPGKDSFRFTEAGADNVVIASDNTVAMIKKVNGSKSIEELLLLFEDVDIVIVEGFKGNEFPKIEVYRKNSSKCLLYKNSKYNFQNFIAIVTNENLMTDIPVFDINDIKKVADFIENNFIGGNKNEENRGTSCSQI
ncbi:molybdopterin-guanine dinucleotide biosynthesis protein B [Clostridium sp. AWRP]|uniref:molybdopterin-guanine dinucleotide biosynthesis protein B n=1 Tax=Clostridium sp. AWRP TaxID=2212991 RepID=UPI000FD974BF|nr:molybdopterin-guanine dinucleotide biosynthesis protein B [Clostridium sp. AWRP]AZV55701.1 molybdopterin-guanine dinucleotide biosynthesis protein B [Clostridium sp. AWRP]